MRNIVLFALAFTLISLFSSTKSFAQSRDYCTCERLSSSYRLYVVYADPQRNRESLGTFGTDVECQNQKLLSRTCRALADRPVQPDSSRVPVSRSCFCYQVSGKWALYHQNGHLLDDNSRYGYTLQQCRLKAEAAFSCR